MFAHDSETSLVCNAMDITYVTTFLSVAVAVLCLCTLGEESKVVITVVGGLSTYV